MSKGTACTCPKHGPDAGVWRVVHYKCNYSAFNGYKYTRSDYSSLVCLRCRTSWRTKALYVNHVARISAFELDLLRKNTAPEYLKRFKDI